MSIENVMALLSHPAPGLWCENNTDLTDKREYLVPVEHVCDAPPASQAIGALSSHLGQIPGCEQVVTFYAKHNGANLFTNPRTRDGAVYLLPLEDWADRQEEALVGIHEELDYYKDEDAPDLPFTLDRLLAIAALNWSPDTWFLATDGPAAGKVFFWGHDGEPLINEPYSDDFAGFVTRLFKETPDCFGGIIRFTEKDAVGQRPPAGTELYPIRYVADRNEPRDLVDD